MNKSQLLILLIIIALVFYYLNEEKQSFKQKPSFAGDQNKPKSSGSNSLDKPWVMVKKSPKLQATKLISAPASSINLPPAKLAELLSQGWPTHFPAQPAPPQPVNFGLNPLHSQLNEPGETIQPTELIEPINELFADDHSLNETYRQRFLTLLNDFMATSLILQATEVLAVKDKPLHEYFSAIWKLKGLTNYPEILAQPLREWINLTNPIKPPNAPTDYGWLTDDNLEFILNNYQPIQSALAKVNQTTKLFHLRTDLANIYNSFHKAQSQQDWELPEFLQRLELTKVQYTLSPLRVNGNHWGLFILHNLTWQELEANYVVYYTSSGGMSLEQEKQQLQPFINQICGVNTPIQIIQPQDRQSKGYECGVYLVFYVQEILETEQLKLTRTHSSPQCQQFRWEWKERNGSTKWCQI